MDDQKHYPDVDISDNAYIEHIFNCSNRYYQEVTITDIDGDCPCGHTSGETFSTTDLNYDGLCGSLYQAIHPQLTTLQYGGGITLADNAHSFTALCPEKKVQVAVKRMAHAKPCELRSKTRTKDMTGKGFSAVDTYRVYLEILGIDRHCGWGQKEGQRFAVDPFNIGGTCGYLYWGAYHFMNLLYSGGSLPWEADANIIHGACPDIFNVVSYRLIREKR